MSVVSVREIVPPGGEHQGVARIDTERHLLVETNDKADTEITIYESGLLPGYLSPHPKITRATVRRVRCRREGGEASLFWRAVISYSTAPFDEQELQFAQEANLNPLDRRARVSLEAVQTRKFDERGYRIDPINGEVAAERTQIVNSAGEPFEPSPAHDIDWTQWLLNVEKNVDQWPLWLTDYENKVNDDVLVIGNRVFPTATLKLERLRLSDLKNENGVQFYTMSFSLRYEVDGWDQDWLDQGFNEKRYNLNTRKYELVPIYIKGGEPMRPQLLNGSGLKLDFDENGERTPVYRRYRRYPARDFTVLPLV